MSSILSFYNLTLAVSNGRVSDRLLHGFVSRPSLRFRPGCRTTNAGCVCPELSPPTANCQGEVHPPITHIVAPGLASSKIEIKDLIERRLSARHFLGTPHMIAPKLKHRVYMSCGTVIALGRPFIRASYKSRSSSMEGNRQSVYAYLQNDKLY
jgi:hypothetical protein